MVSAERPVRSHQRSRSSGAKIRGTRAGRGVDESVAEAAGDVVAEAGGAHLGDGEAAGGDDDGVGGGGCRWRFRREAGVSV